MLKSIGKFVGNVVKGLGEVKEGFMAGYNEEASKNRVIAVVEKEATKLYNEAYAEGVKDGKANKPANKEDKKGVVTVNFKFVGVVKGKAGQDVVKFIGKDNVECYIGYNAAGKLTYAAKGKTPVECTLGFVFNRLSQYKGDDAKRCVQAIKNLKAPGTKPAVNTVKCPGCGKDTTSLYPVYEEGQIVAKLCGVCKGNRNKATKVQDNPNAVTCKRCGNKTVSLYFAEVDGKNVAVCGPCKGELNKLDKVAEQTLKAAAEAKASTNPVPSVKEAVLGEVSLECTCGKKTTKKQAEKSNEHYGKTLCAACFKEAEKHNADREAATTDDTPAF